MLDALPLRAALTSADSSRDARFFISHRTTAALPL